MGEEWELGLWWREGGLLNAQRSRLEGRRRLEGQRGIYIPWCALLLSEIQPSLRRFWEHLIV